MTQAKSFEFRCSLVCRFERRETLMRRFAIAALAAAACYPAWARGQDYYPSVPPITGGSELASYCLYANMIYSIGATICVQKQGQVCVPPPNPNMGPNAAGRAYWSSTTVDIWVPPGLGQCP
jgi:hypothetical protein